MNHCHEISRRQKISDKFAALLHTIRHPGRSSLPSSGGASSGSLGLEMHGIAGEINIKSAHIRRTCHLQNLNLRSLRDKLHGEIGSLKLRAILPAGGNNKGMKNMVGAPLRGRAFLHMDIFLFNDVSRFRHNESGFSQIFIYCGCVKSHGRVWKNEGLGVISMVFVGRKLHVGKGSCTLFLLFVSAAFAAKVS